MNASEIQEAVRYNKRRGYTAARVKSIQELVGAKPVDGVWGPATVRAVATWQASAGLKPDGKVGNVTFTEMQEALECGSSFELGGAPRLFEDPVSPLCAHG